MPHSKTRMILVHHFDEVKMKNILNSLSLVSILCCMVYSSVVFAQVANTPEDQIKNSPLIKATLKGTELQYGLECREIGNIKVSTKLSTINGVKIARTMFKADTVCFPTEANETGTGYLIDVNGIVGDGGIFIQNIRFDQASG